MWLSGAGNGIREIVITCIFTSVVGFVLAASTGFYALLGQIIDFVNTHLASAANVDRVRAETTGVQHAQTGA